MRYITLLKNGLLVKILRGLGFKKYYKAIKLPSLSAAQGKCKSSDSIICSNDPLTKQEIERYLTK